jgi:hypothetical protein
LGVGRQSPTRCLALEWQQGCYEVSTISDDDFLEINAMRSWHSISAALPYRNRSSSMKRLSK